MEWSGVEWSGVQVEWSGVEWSGVETGVEFSGVEWSGVEWSGSKERSGSAFGAQAFFVDTPSALVVLTARCVMVNFVLVRVHTT